MNLGNRYAQHSFAQNPKVNMARSQFLLNHTAKDTMDFDYLTPFYVREILPGDTFNVNVNVFARLATQKVPIMDNMHGDYHFFFVPNRLVWDNWERFNGAQDDPGDSTDYLIPQLVAPAITGFPVGSMADHFGLPTGVPGISVNALPFRMYNLIYNEWYRNQNVINSLVINKGDGPDSYSDYTFLQFSAPAHDYFTSALPWPQKGPAVQLPLGTSAPVITNEQNPNITTAGGVFTDVGLNVLTGGGAINAASGPAMNQAFAWGSETGMQADLTEATAATINQLRQAMMVQSLLELDARGGTRYTEILLAHFNVTSPDFRLQRPEFLGGGRVQINTHPVAQTSPTSGADYQANLAAFGTMSSTGGRIGYSKSFVEHGYVIGLCRFRADITYQNGIRRDWSRLTRYDYFWPKLQLMGEQSILNKEIFATGVTVGPDNDDDVFGYAERYAEYRNIPSEIRGQFRSTYAQSLDVWHLAQEFASLPFLNSPFFFNSQTPIERCIANSNAPHLLVDMFFEEKAARPMVANPVPATLGRF